MISSCISIAVSFEDILFAMHGVRARIALGSRRTGFGNRLDYSMYIDLIQSETLEWPAHASPFATCGGLGLILTPLPCAPAGASCLLRPIL